MDKETLSNYGWIVILVLILSVLLALASPFGLFVAGAIKSTTAGFFSVNQNALGAVGIDIADNEFDSTADNESSSDIQTVPVGATYYTSGGSCPYVNRSTRDWASAISGYETVLNEGEPLPEPQQYDILITEDYFYIYGVSIDYFNNLFVEGGSTDGWAVSANTVKEQYGDMYSSINGQPVTDGSYCFAFTGVSQIGSLSSNLVVTTEMFGGFMDMGTYTIPTQIENIILPATVTSIGRETFAGCVNLTSVTISNTVTYIGEKVIRGCSDLTIIFQGSKSEWEVIEKGSNWDYGATYTIYCTDGTIEKS